MKRKQRRKERQHKKKQENRMKKWRKTEGTWINV
jgi:hypothetical protein